MQEEVKPDWFDLCMGLVLGAVLGFYINQWAYGEETFDYFTRNQDKLFCFKSPKDLERKCFVIREFNHPGVDEYLKENRGK